MHARARAGGGERREGDELQITHCENIAYENGVREKTLL